MVDTFAPDGNSPMKVAPEMVEAVSRLKSSAASISGLGWEATPYTPLGLPVLKLIAVAQAGTAHKDRIVRPKPATLRIILRNSPPTVPLSSAGATPFEHIGYTKLWAQFKSNCD